jgi:hypothetical protein
MTTLFLVAKPREQGVTGEGSQVSIARLFDVPYTPKEPTLLAIMLPSKKPDWVRGKGCFGHCFIADMGCRKKETVSL